MGDLGGSDGLLTEPTRCFDDRRSEVGLSRPSFPRKQEASPKAVDLGCLPM